MPSNRGRRLILLRRRISAVVLPAVTWNPADKNSDLALSNGNLTFAQGTTFAYEGLRATTSHSTGKYYFEVTLVTMFDAFVQVGIGNASQVLTQKVGGTGLNSVGAMATDRGTYLNNTFSATWAAAGAVAGDIVGVAVDFGNSNIWFRKINGGTPQNWNNSGSADPATNTGGFSISTLNAGPYFPMASADTAADSMTANFAGSFIAAAPSGFGIW